MSGNTRGYSGGRGGQGGNYLQQPPSYGMRQRANSRRTESDFLMDMTQRFQIAPQQLSGIYDKVSKSRADLEDFLNSNGQRQELLWTTDEDDMLKKHY